MAQKMYAAQAESAGGATGAQGDAGAGESTASGDDAVDAEFEEVDDDKK